MMGNLSISNSGILPCSIIANYPFNDNTLDEVGGYNGTPHGGIMPTTDRFGTMLSAYDFEGVDDYISIDDTTVLNFTGDFSVNFWVKPDYNTTSALIVSKYLMMSNLGYEISINYMNPNSYELNFILEDGLGSNYLSSNNMLDTVSYAMITAIRTGGDIQIWINGNLDASEVVMATGDLTNGDTLTFGGDPSNMMYFDGEIDDISFYDCALDQSKIDSLYHEGGWGTAQTCAIGTYPFDGDVQDVSGNNHHGMDYGPIMCDDRFGANNAAYEFSSQSDIIGVNMDTYDIEYNFSFSAWYMINSGSDTLYFFSKTDSMSFSAHHISPSYMFL